MMVMSSGDGGDNECMNSDGDKEWGVTRSDGDKEYSRGDIGSYILVVRGMGIWRYGIIM